MIKYPGTIYETGPVTEVFEAFIASCIVHRREWRNRQPLSLDAHAKRRKADRARERRRLVRERRAAEIERQLNPDWSKR